MKRGRYFRKPRPKVMVALLLFALGLTAVLGYQAQAAARSHRAAAERALHDYASFAMWELNQHAAQDILGALIATFIVPLTRVDPARPSEWPDAGEFGVVARSVPLPAKYLDGVRTYFRFDWRDSSVTTAGETPSPTVRRWMRDTVSAYPRLFTVSPALRAQSFGSADRSPARRLGVVITNDSYVTIIDSLDGRWRALAYVVSRAMDGRPVVTYGFESDAHAFVAPIFQQILDRTALLPPSLVRGTSRDSILSVAVTAARGRELFHSSSRFPSDYVARDTLDERFSNLGLELALRPQMASVLVVGGLPRSRLPLLGALLALTAGLVAIALYQLRRQEELTQTRQDFVSGVSHELRTPLAQIRLFAELLRNGQLRSDDERRRSIEIIDEEAMRLTYLVENVLSFSRSEHATSSVALQPLPLQQELAAAADAFTPLARARRATIEVESAGALTVMADPRALRQILLNLLDNAVKYGPVGQTVRIGAESAGEWARIRVEDSGPGVPLGERDRVWEAYYRLDRDAEASAGGSGIGLSIVHELVRLQGGKVWVEDGNGSASGLPGARFVIELKRSSGNYPSAEAPPPLRAVAGGMR